MAERCPLGIVDKRAIWLHQRIAQAELPDELEHILARHGCIGTHVSRAALEGDGVKLAADAIGGLIHINLHLSA